MMRSNSETSNQSSKNNNNVKFLSKTKNEEISDQSLLGRMQTCFECLTESFTKYGGQMRQFIVDDKGTYGCVTFFVRIV